MKVKTWLVALLIIWLASCKALRNVEKTSESSEASESETTITVRKSDTLEYIVPRVTYKDTTITHVSEEKVILKTKYDSTGRIEQIYCIPPEILEYMTRSSQSKDQEREKEVSSEWRTLDWFYIAAIVAIFLLLLIKIPRVGK